MSFHHGTIRKYTAALMGLFNNFEIQYTDSNNNLLSRNIPIKYSSREKSNILDDYTTEQLLTGNYNILPRANLSLISIIRADGRIKNKNIKINNVAFENTIEYMYNSVPYEFTYDLNFLCRGMNEATMIIEQVLPKFNPIYNIDIYDAENLNEPTRIPVKLLDVSIQTEEYEELSSNIMTVTMSFNIQGNLYPPIKSIERIKEFKMTINQLDNNYVSRKAILGWDVKNDGGTENPSLFEVSDYTFAPTIIDLVANNFELGINKLSLIYEDKDSKYNELVFEWELIDGVGILIGNGDSATLQVNVAGNYEVQVKIFDSTGNYTSIIKTFITS